MLYDGFKNFHEQGELVEDELSKVVFTVKFLGKSRVFAVANVNP